MRIIFFTSLIICSLFAFGQNKALIENFGKYRLHKIESFSIDTINDSLHYNAIVNIYREGIDGNYTIEISKESFNNNNKAIDELFIKPRYIDFLIQD